MGDELKPCAHCAKPGIEIEHRCGDFHEWSIECSGCYCRTDWYSLRDAAIFAWNTRADDAPEQLVDNAQADSRERLEADAGELTADYAASGGVCDALYQGIVNLLDRQASITEREYMEQATTRYIGLDCAECADGMGAYADSLCDPLKERIVELTAERDELETKHERIVQEMVDANTRQCERTNELTAERDELRDIIAHMPKTEAECEACQEAHDRLMFNAKVHQDELRDELKHKQLVIDRQRDSFLKLERECAELRRMLADAAEAI